MVGVPRGTVDRILAPRPAAPGSILGDPKFFREISPEFFQRNILCCRDLSTAHCLKREWTAQSLIVDRTHIVLIRGKLVLQKAVFHQTIKHLG